MMDGCDRDFLCQLNIAQKKVLGNTAQETKLVLYSLFTKESGDVSECIVNRMEIMHLCIMHVYSVYYARVVKLMKTVPNSR